MATLSHTNNIRLVPVVQLFEVLVFPVLVTWTIVQLVRAFQVLQNRAARCVTKLGWYTPTRKLIKQCNWLSVKQLIVLQVHRIVKCGCSLYLIDRLVSNYFYLTRQAAGGGVHWLGQNPGELSPVLSSFLGQATTMCNSVLAEIRQSTSFAMFKNKLKIWIKIQIDIT
jgi:hypothetical protein